ncbi:MAG: acetyl-CoA C-acetyltransferase [Nitrososphaerota archaeon]|jgi:acetyl-CoA C-acetyltransferase|nr:acetyl-CoA C-acetyltransferase [Nitrososphaerota archaeon]MDG6942053.1 acetyl-CoA C-acetyltransferase [Nitrososphaerota archaeon]MDG6942518.1 acetyl-CoA C-acetyltransferase [Nitrososphaerota archaeon]MDG6948305.1 acetyl-CoA C-acetyltransferase [Nitrososphaerota archaeon]MDG6950231.1 acetyl-CoA C-acetyltransferase [Nitrososphaerota archaeon]
MTDPVILSACRTPIGKFGKSLVGVAATELGALVIEEAMKRARVEPGEVDEVIMGNVVSAGLGQNPARQAAVHAGVPFSVGAFTVNKVCGSGLKAVMLAAQSVKAGDNDIVVAGGMESMSNVPYLAKGVRWGTKFGDARLLDGMIVDGLWDAYHDYHMGVTGENVAKRFRISRREADEYAYQSHMKATRASEDGTFELEKVKVKVKREGGETAEFSADECVRGDTTVEKLAKLKPVFKPDGVLTAGNSSQLSDGASALIVASQEAADSLGVKPLASIVGYQTGGIEPARVMEAPIPTTKALLRRLKMDAGDVDLFEHNEAYSTASIAVRKALGVDESRFNVWGGAVALGHPIGCSGARVLTTLIYGMKREGKKTGLATLCLGGGNAVSMVVESWSP